MSAQQPATGQTRETMMERKTETKTLVCVLTEGEQATYQQECSSLEGALWSIDQRSKRLGLQINGLKLDHDALIYANRFGLVETDAIDEWGGYVLVPIGDKDARQKLATDLLDVTCKIAELREKRQLVLGRKKAADARIVELAQALRSGKEDREVECEWRRDTTEGCMDLIRTDTWEIIQSRPFTDQEKQLELDLQKQPRAMVQCPVCPLRVTITGGRLDAHLDLDKQQCITTGLTTVQAETFGARINEHPKMPNRETLEGMKASIVGQNPQSKPVRIVEPVEEVEAEEEEGGDGEEEAQEELAVDDGVEVYSGTVVECRVCGLTVSVVEDGSAPWPALLDHTGDVEMSPCLTSGMSPQMAHGAYDIWHNNGYTRDPEQLQAIAEAIKAGREYQAVVKAEVSSDDPADVTKRILDQMGLAMVADIYPRHIGPMLELAGKDAAEVRAYLLGQCADELKGTTKRNLAAWGG